MQKVLKFTDFNKIDNDDYIIDKEDDFFELAILEDMNNNKSEIEKLVEYFDSQIHSLPTIVVNGKEYIDKLIIQKIIKDLI